MHEASHQKGGLGGACANAGGDGNARHRRHYLLLAVRAAIVCTRSIGVIVKSVSDEAIRILAVLRRSGLLRVASHRTKRRLAMTRYVHLAFEKWGTNRPANC